MKLVESDAEGPTLQPEEVVTPPRPEKRRVSISLLFTLTVLIATVGAIYSLLPARNGVLVTEALAGHVAAPASFDLTSLTQGEVNAWLVGALGKGVPQIVETNATPMAAKTISIHRRNAAVVRYRIGGAEVTYLVQHAKGWAPHAAQRAEGQLRAELGTFGKWTVVAVSGRDDKQSYLQYVKLP